MNHSSKHLIRGTLLASLFAGLTGCIVIKISVDSPQGRTHQRRDHDTKYYDYDGKSKPVTPPPGRPYEYLDFENPPPPEHVWGPYTRTDDPNIHGLPIGDSGTLIIPTSSFLSGSHSCFPSAQGWNKYFIITNYIVGPNTPLVPNCFTNDTNTTVTVKTCDSANNTSVKTGIVIYNLDNPNGDKKCVTNSPACLGFTNLTINTRNITNNMYYRAVIYYKSSTLGGLTSVTVKWSYP